MKGIGDYRPIGYNPAIKSRLDKPSVNKAVPDMLPQAGASGPTDSVAEFRGGPLKPQLSQEQRKALVESFKAESLKSAQKEAIVVGGGPGGLAAAITLAKMGVKVTVLEARANEAGDKPAHARPHQISLRQDSLNTLKNLGAYDQVMEKSGFVDKEVHIKSKDGLHHHEEKIPEAKAHGENKLGLISPNTLLTDSVSQVRISDIETSLYDQAVKHGVEIKSGVQATLAPSADGKSYSVGIQKVQKDAETGYKPVGEMTDLGTPDLVVVADGAGSPTRTSLGIGVIEESASKNYLGGHIQKGLGAETRKATIVEADGSKRHVMGTGHAKYDQTWVSVEITPEEAKMSPKERAQLLADKAQVVMGQEVTTADIGWGAGQLTTVQNRRAEKTTAGDNVVLLGDSAGTGSVWVGGGLNLALTTHLSALKNAMTRIQSGSDRGATMEIYDKTIQWATSVWHKAGAAELGPAPQTPAKAS